MKSKSNTRSKSQTNVSTIDDNKWMRLFHVLNFSTILLVVILAALCMLCQNQSYTFILSTLKDMSVTIVGIVGSFASLLSFIKDVMK